ncbi:MAG: FISUMP domain-containing protein [Bacteroidota bacterium]
MVTSAFALPGGLRNNNGDFNNMTNNGYWWSSSVSSGSNAWSRNLFSNASNFTRDYGSRSFGFSVRCCRD